MIRKMIDRSSVCNMCGFLVVLTVLTSACSPSGETPVDVCVSDTCAPSDDVQVDAVDVCESEGCAISPCVQNELKAAAPVLNTDGSLATIGWARRPIFEYDPTLIPAAMAEGLKNWDFYSVQSPEYYFEVTVAELAMFSFIGVTVLNYATGEKLSGWDLGDSRNVTLPTSPYSDAGWKQGDNTISVTFEDGYRVLSFNIPGKFGGIDMSGEVRLADGPGRESLAVVQPKLAEGTFFYEDKIFGMRTSGTVKAGELEVTFDPETAWGVLDWGRGVWPKEVQWFWAAGYGEVDGHDVAFNMGAGEDVITRASNDGILVDGVIHKIGSFTGTPWEMDPDDPMKPWVIRSPDGRMDLTLTPHTFVPTELDISDFYMHGIKVYGTYAGKLILDDCTSLDIHDFAGFAERSTQKW